MTSETLIAIAAIGAPIMGAVLVTAWRAGARIQQLVDGQASLGRRIARVEAEVSYNSGISLKDRIEAVHALEVKLLQTVKENAVKIDKLAVRRD